MENVKPTMTYMDTVKKLNELVYELSNKQPLFKKDKLFIVVNGVTDDEVTIRDLFLQRIPMEQRANSIKGFSLLQHLDLKDGYFVSKEDSISLYNERTKENILFSAVRKPFIQNNDKMSDEQFTNKCMTILSKLKKASNEEDIRSLEDDTTDTEDDDSDEVAKEIKRISDDINKCVVSLDELKKQVYGKEETVLETKKETVTDGNKSGDGNDEVDEKDKVDETKETTPKTEVTPPPTSEIEETPPPIPITEETPPPIPTTKETPPPIPTTEETPPPTLKVDTSQLNI